MVLPTFYVFIFLRLSLTKNLLYVPRFFLIIRFYWVSRNRSTVALKDHPLTQEALVPRGHVQRSESVLQNTKYELDYLVHWVRPGLVPATWSPYSVPGS